LTFFGNVPPCTSQFLILESLLKEAQNQDVRLVIIGGYAVAAYTRGYGFTKDIDLVADRPTLGKLMGLLKTLGYVIRETGFGIAGNKKLNGAFIHMHISVGRIYDISTGKKYHVNASLFRNAKDLIVKGYIPKTTSLRAAVVELEALVILKIMPVGRGKDAVDLLSLLRDKRKELRLDAIAALRREKYSGGAMNM
jgi:hypothetical protein